MSRLNRGSIYRQVAALHAANIDQGFLATLGTPFLALMYRAIDEAASSVLLIEEQDGEVRGFVSGGSGMASIYKRMLKRPFRLGWALLPSLARPSRVLKIAEILRYKPDHSSGSDLPKAELLSIAMDARFRGTGLADCLFQRLESHFASSGISEFRIVVGKALEPAHRFYCRMGASPVGETRLHKGETSIIYVQQVHSRNP